MNFVVTLLVGMLFIRPTDSFSQQGCGEVATRTRGKIYGGKHSRLGMWPWHVGIHKQSISEYHISCGGALIAPQWVLTAAHCFYESRTNGSKIWYEEDITSLKKYKVIAGHINTQIREISEQEKFPIEVYIHQSYRDSPYYENDIALVKLNQKVTLNPLVRTVCLPISNVDFAKPGTVGTVAGWGKTRKSGISTVLLHTTLEIQNNTVCDLTTHYFFNRTVTFCAGDSKGNKDSCTGDSGGSLVRSVVINGKRRWVAVGLVSWGDGCAIKDKYGYYTRIHSFVDWIKDTINYSLPCQDPGIPQGGSRHRHSFLHGDKVTFSCKKGWKMEGEKNITCNNGRWNYKTPTCLGNCRDVGNIQNAVITKINDRQGIPRISALNYKNGDRIVIRCRDGFRIKGNPVLKCTDGTWSDNKPTCIGVCPSVNPPQHGERLDLNFDYGSTVQFRCHYGYTLRGMKSVTCMNGTWSNKAPVCKADCQDPGTPANGQRDGSLFSHLQIVRFSCDKEFIMLGASSIQCLDGTWSSNKPVCTECGSPLGMESKKIPDKNIRASSSWSRRYDAKYGRLNDGSAWCSDLIARIPYLEIDLGKPYKITYLATQGGDRKWVSKYVMSHNLARSIFIEYREASKEKLFTGNTDATSIVKHKLKKPFIARKIRFIAIGLPLFGRAFYRACMRVEVYGCELPNDCVMVGSRVLGRWQDNYRGGDIYYKAIVRTIGRYNVQLEIEDENHHDKNFKSMSKTYLVLDAPNKQWNLPPRTRVLMPQNNKYFTGSIGWRLHQDYYLVDPDNSRIGGKWMKKNEIRVLKPEQFCE